MGKFRKKPVVIEAVQVCPERSEELRDFVNGGRDCLIRHIPNFHVSIITLEGTMTGNEGDWIIRGVKGELYPCKPDIFDATYEPVED